jgi:hypothetical protein
MEQQGHDHALTLASRYKSFANRSRKMKKQLWFVCIGLPALAIVPCSSFAEPAQVPTSTANSALNQKSAKQITNDCEAEWKANQDAMIKGGMTEDLYVQQCSLKADVPDIPEPKTKAALSSTPK